VEVARSAATYWHVSTNCPVNSQATPVGGGRMMSTPWKDSPFALIVCGYTVET